ncbi:hypothetical protein ElyMa_000720400 [Elysia marginata]|uniref:Uncharacterized protein n=1 Tax=Elysia marginata TaxID=1093978 RepID=A0AAV4GMD0_9GAST|nr:hypothetical protein ElyMa_000720400 [Elysia marginata]
MAKPQLMMGDIAIRRILSQVTKALSCSRPPLTAPSSCPFRQHTASQAAPASSVAVPSPDIMSSPETNSSTPTAMHDLSHGPSRGTGSGLGADTLSNISPAPTVLSPQHTSHSPSSFTSKDSGTISGATTNFYTSAASPTSVTENSCPASERQPTCPHASAARPKQQGEAASSESSFSSPRPRPESPSTKPRGSVQQIRPFTDLPCPPGWPIIGSFLDYFKEENRGQMHELMRQHAPGQNKQTRHPIRILEKLSNLLIILRVHSSLSPTLCFATPVHEGGKSLFRVQDGDTGMH